MSLLETIRADQITARKEKQKDKATILTTLYSEAANVGLNDGKRESTDKEVLAVIKKFLKGVEETLAVAEGTCTPLLLERQILINYLPPQLSEDDLTTIVTDLIQALEAPSMRDMGSIMKTLGTEYDGRYDGKMASTIIKEALS